MTPTTQDYDFALMLDIETTATRPTARVLQIGYALGNLKTQEIIDHGAFWPFNRPDVYSYESEDPDTMKWWSQQDPEVRKRVFEPERREHPQYIAGFIIGMLRERRCEIWASPAMFDLPILTNMWGHKPWSYKDERCMMTLYKLIDPQGLLKPGDNAMAHDAEQDAIWQLQYLFALKAKLAAMQQVWDAVPEVSGTVPTV